MRQFQNALFRIIRFSINNYLQYISTLAAIKSTLQRVHQLYSIHSITHTLYTHVQIIHSEQKITCAPSFAHNFGTCKPI